MRNDDLKDGARVAGKIYDDGVQVMSCASWTSGPVSVNLCLGDEPLTTSGQIDFRLKVARARALHEALGLALAHLDAPTVAT